MKLQLILLDDLFYRATGPTGPKGEIGPTGPNGSNGLYEGIFFTGFVDANTSGLMEIVDSWVIHNNYFRVLNKNDIEVDSGLYEITFSGLIEDASDDSGASFYLLNGSGEAIKDLTFDLFPGEGKQMSFSQSILFRFVETTTLHVEANIDGTLAKVVGVNLIIKKINEN